MILLNDCWLQEDQKNRLQQVAVKLCNYQHLTGSESSGFGRQPIRRAFQNFFQRGDFGGGCEISGVCVCVVGV